MSSGLHNRVRRMEREQGQAQNMRPLYVVGPVDENNMCDVVTLLPGKATHCERVLASETDKLRKEYQV